LMSEGDENERKRAEEAHACQPVVSSPSVHWSPRSKQR
jgi:hypothetical protein